MIPHDFIRVSPDLNVPGAESQTAIWQTQSGPCRFGMFKLTANECVFFEATKLGTGRPSFKVMNDTLFFYRQEGDGLAEYSVDITDGIVRCIRDQNGKFLYGRPISPI